MNFEPNIILAPGRGSNADTRTVSVRVMNDRSATPVQLAQLAHAFELHKLKVANSLAGLNATDGKLPDGSQFRIVSNSGIHTVMLWPAGGGTIVLLDENFWGIPSSLTAVSNSGGRWRVGNDDTSMPTQLSFSKPRAQQATDSTAHPGPTTWSSPNFKADKQEIVVSWRGPRARYTASSGWTNSGAAFTQHALSSYDFGSLLGQRVFKDSSFVWINDKKKSTPVNKIIAAAIHCPDPITAPGMVVLRVVTDNLSNDNVTRALGAKDLVPTGATAPVSIQALVEATSLVVLNTYTYAGEGLGVGQWRLWQRPHFNAAGDKIATFITGSQGDGPAALDATTGVVTELGNLDGTQILGGSQSISDTGVGTDPRIIAIDHTYTGDVTNKYILGVDFLDGALVWCWVETRSVSTYTVSEDETSGTVAPYSLTASNVYSENITRSVKHSVHGTLWTSGTHNYAWTSSYNSSGTVGTFGGSQEGPARSVAFTGDLSRDVLAFGYSTTNGFQRFAGSSSTIEVYNGSLFQRSIKVDGQNRSQPFTFDIWMAGLQRASGTTGSFVNGASTAGAVFPANYDALVLEGLIAQYRDAGGVLAPPPTGTTALDPIGYLSTGSGNLDGSEPFIVIFGASGEWWHHCAVNARRTVAYLGVFYRSNLNFPIIPIVDFGLEAACFLRDEVFTLAPVPVYTGGARPTISAPVFTGVTRKELATS